MKTIQFAALALLFLVRVEAQNLVLNPGFETLQSAKYHNECSFSRKTAR
jgi:hypothetical protein